ncbi:MAG: nicotinate-nucleotide pyrophosphorylase (carboxylating) [Flavobacteriales bacterium]|jgi:nicotinate-nucleotide pyrophosphorylase (carboxylating)
MNANQVNDLKQSVRIALAEDIGDGDITAMLIPEEKQATATIITRENCVLCGQSWLEETFNQLGGIHSIEWHAKDGDQLKPNDAIVSLKGNARSLLTGERTALNFLQLLSGTASLAAQYAQAAEGCEIKILDTRKTVPGLRLAQKYAVKTGGCDNHRIALYDAFLIKENHIAACGSITQAISQAKIIAPGKKVEVEVENIDELKQALSAGADIIMLDNFSEAQLSEASTLDKGSCKFEASGNLELKDIARLQDYAIDYISFGALTKHVRAVDLSFRLVD